MTISSTAFQSHEPIPAEYGYDGKNVNPPLAFSDVPQQAQSLALIVEDPDAPSGIFTHWILYNIAPATLQVQPGGTPIGAQQATNDFGQQAYGGPRPPSGTHRYVFKLFALDTQLDLPSATKRADFQAAIEGHIIDQAELTGTFST